MRSSPIVALLAGLALGLGCSSGGGTSAIVGASDGGPDAGAAFSYTSFSGKEAGVGSVPADPFSIAVAPDGRIGIAYYWDLLLPDGGPLSKYQLDYLELQPSGGSRDVVIDTGMIRLDGVSNVFDSAGLPIVTYLGNNPALPLPSPPDSGTNYWAQFCTTVATVYPDGGVSTVWPAWESINVDPPGAPAVATEGNVVGLSTAVAAVPDGGLIVSYRDIHFGQFPTDFSKSNWDYAQYSDGAWLDYYIQPGSDSTTVGGAHVGVGEFARVAWGPLGLAVISSGQPEIGGTASGIYFNLLKPTGFPAASALEVVNDIGPTGASLASDGTTTYGVAWVDYAPVDAMNGSSILYYTQSTDAVNWEPPEQVFGSGSGGWDPSLAYDPTTGEANIAFYVCSSEPGVTQCPAAEQGLYYTIRRQANTWETHPVDLSGGRQPQLAFDNNQKLFIVYRDVNSGALKLARPNSTP